MKSFDEFWDKVAIGLNSLMKMKKSLFMKQAHNPDNPRWIGKINEVFKKCVRDCVQINTALLLLRLLIYKRGETMNLEREERSVLEVG